jgi:lipopolysaccharide transport system permease protein
MNTTRNLSVVVYDTTSQIRTPGLLLRSMWQDAKDSRELSWRLFIRDISAQYRQSLFGILWAFVPPIIASVIFIVLKSRNVVNFGETDIPYPVYVLVGTILWQLFTESLNAPLKSVTMAKPLLAKINFPREALIISSIYLVVFNLLIKLVVLAVILVIYQMPLTWGLLLAPLAILMLVLLGIGAGLLLTPLGALYTDVATSLPIIVQLFFFVTPVVYPPPQTFPFALLVILNPVSPLLIAARDLIAKGEITNIVPFVVVSGLTVVILFAAWVIYRIALPIIIERMSA